VKTLDKLLYVAVLGGLVVIGLLYVGFASRHLFRQQIANESGIMGEAGRRCQGCMNLS
jgi:hypothetical protein